MALRRSLLIVISLAAFEIAAATSQEPKSAPSVVLSRIEPFYPPTVNAGPKSDSSAG